MYEDSAPWYEVRYAGKDYAAEAAQLRTVLAGIHPKARTLLDVACGTGSHLLHLAEDYEVEGLDLNPTLLDAARGRLPQATFHQHDMVDFSLGKSFDVVTCLFAAIGYLQTEDRVRQAVAAMAAHLSPGGVLYLEPWLSPSAFRDDELVLNSQDYVGGKMSWMYRQKRVGDRSVMDIHYLLGAEGADVVHFVEHEEMALLSDDQYRAAFADAGLAVRHVAGGLHGYGAYVGLKGRPWTDAEAAWLT